jgi:hypothetical protein
VCQIEIRAAKIVSEPSTTGQVFFGFDKYQFEEQASLPPQGTEIYYEFSSLSAL